VITLTLFLALVAGMAFLLMNRNAGDLAGYMVFLFVLRRSMLTFGFFNRFQVTVAMIDGMVQEISNMFSDEDKHFVVGGVTVFPGLKERIDFHHLNFSYGHESPVLKDVSFSIPQGQMTAIVGATGSGKTTLVNLLMRFYDCPPESILIDSQDIRSFTLESLRKAFAYVGQDTQLFNETLRYNLSYGLDRSVTDTELKQVVERAQLEDFIKKLPKGFETFVGDRGVRLSGGERQRIAIARAFLKGSEILILDEATSAIDTATEKQIQDAIEVLIRGKTTIVIAHRLSTVKHADKLIILKDGRVTEAHSFDELTRKSSPLYQNWEGQKV